MSLRAFLWSFVTVSTLGTYGDMPHGWSQSARVYHAKGGDVDELMEVVGCVLEEPIGAGKSMQCGEDFLWIGPRSTVRLALARIANVQVEGYAQEARAFTGTVGTIGDGRVDRGVVFHASCYGNVAECIVELGHGWEFRSTPERLELHSERGREQSWSR